MDTKELEEAPLLNTLKQPIFLEETLTELEEVDISTLEQQGYFTTPEQRAVMSKLTAEAIELSNKQKSNKT